MTDVSDQFRRPRCQIVLNGLVFDTYEGVEFSVNNLRQAGSFFLRLALPSGPMGQADLSLVDNAVAVSIRIGLLTTGAEESTLAPQEMFSGQVDRVCVDPVSGTLTLEGRDYSSRLLDLPLSDNFLNCTSSELVTQLCERSGLTPIVDNTSNLVGQYYQIEHARLALPSYSRFSTAWDLACNLAQLEQFDLWVQGSSLNFRQAAPASAQTYRIDLSQPSGNAFGASLAINTLSLERAVPLTGGTAVQVSSWNSRQRQRLTAISGNASGGQQAVLSVMRPNLLQSSAQSLADGIAFDAGSHARVLRTNMPGEVTLSPRDVIALVGVGAGWDGSYLIYQIDRELGLASGFTQTVLARNLIAQD